MKVISVHDDMLNFRYIKDIGALQEKFDGLFIAARLMGYKINRECIASNVLKKIYYFYSRENTEAMVCFHIRKEEVKRVVLISLGDRQVFEEQHEKELLTELDKFMIRL